MSMPPVFGRKLRIGRKNGSVNAKNRFQTARTKSLRMLTTPNAISQDRHRAGDNDQLVEIESVDDNVEDRAHVCSQALRPLPAPRRRLDPNASVSKPLTWHRRARTQPRHGAVAQMGERCNRTAEVRGSNPLSSTKQSPDSESASSLTLMALEERRTVESYHPKPMANVPPALLIRPTCGAWKWPGMRSAFSDAQNSRSSRREAAAMRLSRHTRVLHSHRGTWIGECRMSPAKTPLRRCVPRGARWRCDVGAYSVSCCSGL